MNTPADMTLIEREIHRCPACRTTGFPHHEPNSDECREVLAEKLRSQST